jgi:hypothetical protein
MECALMGYVYMCTSVEKYKGLSTAVLSVLLLL